MINRVCEEAIYSDNYLDLITEYDIERSFFETNYNPTCIQYINSRFAAVYFDSNIHPPYSVQQYGYQHIPKCYGLMDDSSMQASGILQVQQLPALNLRGSQVIIGFIDTGIDYTNPLFQKADGTTRIAGIWDQTIRTGVPPESFYYGSEYTEEQINEALASENPLEIVPSRDENGHGTFLAGLAAGGQDENENFIGAAPEAIIVVVKLKEAKNNLRNFHEIHTDNPVYQENDIMMGVSYIREIATKLLHPIIYCIGLGSNQGEKEGKGALSSLLSRLGETRDVCVVTAAGNEGQARHHYFGGGRKGQSMENVEINVGNTRGFSLELWGQSSNTYSIAVRSPGGEVIPRIPARLTESREVQLVLEETRIRIDYQLVESGGGDELILVAFSQPTQGIWTITVYCDELDDTGFHIWLPITQFLSTDTYFIRPDPDTTIVAPATNSGLITVTAYNHITNSLYLEASRGDKRGCNIKPDFAAPGVDVSGPNLRKGYTMKIGSSVAAAITAGAAALLMEWGAIRENLPEMATMEIKKLLIRGATRDNLYTYPNNEWGYGKLNLYQTFQRLTRL